MRSDYLVFGKPDIHDEDIQAVTNVLRSGWIGTGHVAREFEQQFARHVGVEHAMAVGSCTAALHLAMTCFDLGENEDVIVPALTFVSTANAVVHAGHHPVFCDVDRHTMCATRDTITAAASKEDVCVEAAIVVHYAGRPCDDIADIAAVARKNDWRLIEDCAHAIESPVGHYGDAACYSFYATKNITSAEGGMVVTRDPNTADCVRRLALHGLSADAWKRFSDDGYKHYDMEQPGFKYNMTDMQAALGLSQFQRVEASLWRRELIWQQYDEAFADLDLERPAPSGDMRHARHLYTILVEDRDIVMHDLHRLNIGTGVHYRPVHLHDYYRRRYGYEPGMLPNAEWIGDHTLSLPLSPAMSGQDVQDVIDAVRMVLA